MKKVKRLSRNRIKEIRKKLNAMRIKKSDFIIKMDFDLILYQCWNINREDSTLITYQNELECRGLKYSLKRPRL